MTFRVLDIIPNFEQGLTASTVPETDHAAWSSSATYARGDRVISTTTHRIYESARGSNTNRNPTIRSNRYDPETNPGGWWMDVSATNRWKVTDGRIYDRAQLSTSMQWTWTINSSFSAVSVHNLLASTVQCEVLSGSTVISSSTVNLSASDVNLRRAVFTGLAGTAGRAVRITVAGTGTVYCGEITVGRMLSLGTALAGSGEGFSSYSRNETDEYGNPVVIRRQRGGRAQVQAFTRSDDKDRVLRVLAEQDARPAVYVTGSDPNAGGSIVVYGYAEAPFLTMNAAGFAEYVLDIKGTI